MAKLQTEMKVKETRSEASCEAQPGQGRAAQHGSGISAVAGACGERSSVSPRSWHGHGASPKLGIFGGCSH